MGTSAIEVLKECEGVKEAVFAKVSSQVEINQVGEVLSRGRGGSSGGY
jgi:hypothetical protein